MPRQFEMMIQERTEFSPEDRPNWQNEDHYIFMTGCSIIFDPQSPQNETRRKFNIRNSELAWQFLRRNHDYIDAWEHQNHLLQNSPEKAADFVFEVASKFQINHIHPLYSPFLYLPTPLFSANNVPRGRMLRVNNGKGFDAERRPITDDSLEPAIDFRLYLGASFDNQIKNLKKLFIRHQNRLSNSHANPNAKPHKQNLMEYCRVWDALKAGAKPQEIANTLWKNNAGQMNKFYQHKKRAHDLVNGGYVDLLGFM